MVNKGISCIELVPGANTKVIPVESIPIPPGGFIDNTVYRYKMINGEKVLIGTMPPFPENYKDYDFKDFSLQDDEEKGEDNVVKVKSDEWPAIIKRGIELLNDTPDLTLYGACSMLVKEFGLQIRPQSIYGRLKKEYEAKQQTPNPDPAAAANQEPGQGEGEPAGNSVQQDPRELQAFEEAFKEAQEKQDRITDPINMPLGMELPPEPERFSQYDPADNDFTEEDDKPIPFRVVSPEEALKAFNLAPEEPVFDLAPVKIQLIATALAEYKDDLLPAGITVDLVMAIGALSLGVR